MRLNYCREAALKKDSFQARLQARMEKIMQEFSLEGIALFDARGLLIECIAPYPLISLMEIVASYGLVLQEQIRNRRINELTLVVDRRYRIVNGYFGIHDELFVIVLLLIPDQQYNNLLQLSIAELQQLLEERYPKRIRR